MGRREIPLAIKIQVIREWLEDWPRCQISENNNISTGSVSNIIVECKEDDIPFIDVLREVAIMLKQKGVNFEDFA